MPEDDFHIRLAAALYDPANAERCATFPLDPSGVLEAGIYAWHGDPEADRALDAVIGAPLHPLFVDAAGAVSLRTGRARAATLESAIGRTHLRGSTQASSFRRSLAAVLWDELGLRCDRPKRLDRASNARLTVWMLEHLRVVTIAFGDRFALAQAAEAVRQYLDPPFNLVGYPHRPARNVIRARRRRHFALSTADTERCDRIADMRRLVELDPDGAAFLRRRIVQELGKLGRECAS
jgi:hypothetical protein